MLPDGPTTSAHQESATPYSGLTDSARLLDTSLDPAMLQLHTQLYASEYAGRWGRYNAQLLANIGLLTAMTIGSQNVFLHAHLHVITILGAEVSAIWLVISILSARRVTSAADTLSRQRDPNASWHDRGSLSVQAMTANDTW